MKLIFDRLSACLLICVIGLFSGCGGSAGNEKDIKLAPQGIVVSIPSGNVIVGNIVKATASQQFTNGLLEDVTSEVVWSSGDSAVATVDAKGNILGVAAGSTTISATKGALVSAVNIQSRAPTYPLNIQLWGGGIPAGSTLVMQANGAENLSIAGDGTYSFPTQLQVGVGYVVRVLTQPAGAYCSISNGSTGNMTVGGSTVLVSCTAGSRYSIGGTVSGLSGLTGSWENLELLQTSVGSDRVWLKNNGAFTFATGLGTGSAYGVAVQYSPSNFTCTVTNGTGTVASADVTNVSVTCSQTNFSIGGTVTGLPAGTSLALSNNSGTILVVNANGNFVFNNDVASGGGYGVTVATQPFGAVCTVALGTGTATADVTNVAVTCIPGFTLGGSITGLPQNQSLVLQNNGANNLTVISTSSWSDTGFSFPVALANGGAYNVSVLTQPTGQFCTITQAAGTIAGGSVSNVAVKCVSAYSISGSLAGLPASSTITLQNNGADNLNLSIDGGFAFAKQVAGAYNVTVLTQPVAAPHVCNVINGSGIATAAVTTPFVVCAGAVGTLAGSGLTWSSVDGTGTVAEFYYPSGIAIDAVGNAYVADTQSSLIRKISGTGVVTTLAGSSQITGAIDGTGNQARFNFPAGVAVDAAGNLLVADTGNNMIRKVTSAGVVTTFAGSVVPGAIDSIGTAATFRAPAGVTVDGAGNVYVADRDNHKIRKITSLGEVTTLAGSGTTGATDNTGVLASFSSPTGVAVDAAGNVYVADSGNHKIRKVTPVGVVTTIAGSGAAGTANGLGTLAQFSSPHGLSVDTAGNVYVADTGNDLIRKIDTLGVVTTVAGIGAATASVDGPIVATASMAAATFNSPYGVVLDAAGNLLVVEYTGSKIRKIVP